MGQILHFNPAYLYNTINYITKLLVQFLRLYETCRMTCYSLLSNDVNFVEKGLSGYDVKPRFGAFQCKYLLQNPLFFRKKIW